MVENTLSRLYIDSVSHVKKEEQELAKEVHKLSRLGVYLFDTDDGEVVV